ncbi:MAG: hypothetical protein K8T10_18520 [Candidatus Eremiobacteraeota bacterium]|nr:hypothetical protein [Candidatus Eremiobacteraeota bacterium]
MLSFACDELGRKISDATDGQKYSDALCEGSTGYGAEGYGGFKHDNEGTYYCYNILHTRNMQDNFLYHRNFHPC